MGVPLDDGSDNWRTPHPTTSSVVDLFDPNIIVQKAEKRGFNAEEASLFANKALPQIKRLATAQNEHVSREAAIRAVQRRIRVEIDKLEDANPAYRDNDTVGIEREITLAIIEDEIAKSLPPEDSFPQVDIQEDMIYGRHVLRYKFNEPALNEYFNGRDPYADLLTQINSISITETETGRDIITKLCTHVELAVELGKQLCPQDILNLYIASKSFRDAVNGYSLSSIRTWIAHRCPEADRIFPFKLYKRHLVHDPEGRTWGDVYQGSSQPVSMDPGRLDKVRTIPGFRYMQLVLGRDRYCREIMAILARNGHLTPPSMYETLLRLWLLMDTGRTEHRRAMLRNTGLWRDQDLYNAQFLFVKLGMHFSDPRLWSQLVRAVAHHPGPAGVVFPVAAPHAQALHDYR